MNPIQRRQPVSITRRVTRPWWGVALAFLLLLTIDGQAQRDLNAIVRSSIEVDYNGNVVRTYWNGAGGAARTEILGNVNQPGGYRGPLPPGYRPPVPPAGQQPPGILAQRPNPGARPPALRVVSTVRIVTTWGRPVRRFRNGRAYMDWDRHPNGTPRLVQKVGYRYTYSNGGSRLSGVQGAGDATMTRQGYRMVGYDVSTR